ncbi:Holliday junction branch migration protein RuvA [Anaerovorax sp. IOR16]|uniref:Holliday junction branch migration protein RuvA n=1 Tax=Anaerovorax sp. IOR16 TaxID=2773458 RepID=UPI0019D0AD4A|nr:Holliday junction branch migration protein RuvA [Anaerovorax sp. IOR16]
MLHYIKGTIAMKFPGGVVVENNGIGYEIYVPDNSALYLASPGETISVYTAMIVREDDISLYGFSDEEAIDLFRKFMTVSGVGAKAAMALLSCMPVGELKKAIAFEDANALTKANGIGKKTAQRIVLELKEKIGGVSEFGDATEIVHGDNGRTEATNGLIALGYSKSEAVSAVASIEENNLSVEEYIKMALKKLF